MNAKTSSETLSPVERVRNLATFFLRPSVGEPSRATFLVRLAVGSVFLSSGLVKFLFDNQGPGRFAKIGLPHAPALAAFVGTTEVVCGALVLVGLFVRLASLALVVDMMVAIATTKVPLLFGVGPEPVAAPPKTGLWAFAYQARLDVTMLLACGFLVVAGAGLLSLDELLSRRRGNARLTRGPRVTESPAT
ncbi:MAG TPA: DoxX family protein [Polyangiaceae bacterium]|nr:DoxX family protein [Polyangiaceae bacterium]